MARNCLQCGAAISDIARFCEQCGYKFPTDPATNVSGPRIRPAKNNGYKVLLLLVLLTVLAVIRLSEQTYSPDSTAGNRSISRRVTYSVGGTAISAALTYRNDNGGTEQRTVGLPWSLELVAAPGTFLYLSAQNKQEYGSVVATISVDGQLLKTAESSGAYVIASVSAAAPR